MTYNTQNDSIISQLRKTAERAISSENEAKNALVRAAKHWDDLEAAKIALTRIGVELPSDIPSRPLRQTGVNSEAVPPKKNVKKRTSATWKSEILKQVNAAGEIDYPTLKANLAKGPLSDRIAKSDKGFYNGLSRLESEGLLHRHNAHAFTPKAYEAYRADIRSGDREPVEPSSAGRDRQSHVQNKIFDALEGQLEGLKARNIVEAISPCNETSVFNTLLRLVKTKRLYKDPFEKTYRLQKYAPEKTKARALPTPSPRKGDITPLFPQSRDRSKGG